MSSVFTDITTLFPARVRTSADHAVLLEYEHFPAGMRQQRRGAHSGIPSSDYDHIRHTTSEKIMQRKGRKPGRLPDRDFVLCFTRKARGMSAVPVYIL